MKITPNYHHRKFTLAAYDPKWKEKFTEVSEKLKSILGENFVEAIHIGSTSIEGMIGKPQVDIMVVVKNLDAVQKHDNDFEMNTFIVHGLGYAANDDYYITEDSADGSRLSSVHILQEGNPKIVERKIFRDYLESNMQDRELYIATKKKIYAQYKDDYPQYVAHKKEVIGEILARALLWSHK